MDFKKETEQSIGWFVLESNVNNLLEDNNSNIVFSKYQL